MKKWETKSLIAIAFTLIVNSSEAKADSKCIQRRDGISVCTGKMAAPRYFSQKRDLYFYHVTEVWSDGIVWATAEDGRDYSFRVEELSPEVPCNSNYRVCKGDVVSSPSRVAPSEKFVDVGIVDAVFENGLVIYKGKYWYSRGWAIADQVSVKIACGGSGNQRICMGDRVRLSQYSKESHTVVELFENEVVVLKGNSSKEISWTLVSDLNK